MYTSLAGDLVRSYCRISYAYIPRTRISRLLCLERFAQFLSRKTGNNN